MNKILLLSFLLVPLTACQTLQHMAPKRAAANPVVSGNLLAGEYDNHEQVWSARGAAAGAALAPHIVVTLEEASNADWSVWHVHYDASPAIDVVWAMQRTDAGNGTQLLLPHRAIVATPGRGSAFDAKQWTPLAACALRGSVTSTQVRVTADVAACAAIVPGIGSDAALLPLSIDREGEWLHVRLYADQARGADVREDTRKVEIYTGWAAVNGSGPQGAGNGNDWHMNKAIRLGSEGSRAALVWRDGKPSGYSLGLERLTYREGNVPVLKLSLIDDATGGTLAYAWANPEATRIGINLGWAQVGLDRTGMLPADVSAVRATQAGDPGKP
ncbi:MAG: hypothetical protein ABIS07_05770 [Dokdonella sp.]